MNADYRSDDVSAGLTIDEVRAMFVGLRAKLSSQPTNNSEQHVFVNRSDLSNIRLVLDRGDGYGDMVNVKFHVDFEETEKVRATRVIEATRKLEKYVATLNAKLPDVKVAADIKAAKIRRSEIATLKRLQEKYKGVDLDEG